MLADDSLASPAASSNSRASASFSAVSELFERITNALTPRWDCPSISLSSRTSHGSVCASVSVPESRRPNSDELPEADGGLLIGDAVDGDGRLDPDLLR
ncbi:MAG: hypothetical protein R2755_09240 [Acidimicrobiales bacterium]